MFLLERLFRPLHCRHTISDSMSKPQIHKENPGQIFWWVFSGAFLLVAVVVLEHLRSDLPLRLTQLIFPALLGGLAGYLLGRSDLRWRRLSSRLEDSERRFRKLCQDTPAMLHTLDGEGRLLYVSQTWLDRLGYQRDQVIGKNFFDLIINEDNPPLKSDHLEKLRQQGEINEIHYRLRHANQI